MGSHLTDKLMMDGHEVTVVDNFFTGRKRNVEHWIGHENFELINHDVVEPLYIEGKSLKQWWVLSLKVEGSQFSHFCLLFWSPTVLKATHLSLWLLVWPHVVWIKTLRYFAAQCMKISLADYIRFSRLLLRHHCFEIPIFLSSCLLSLL